MRGWLHTYAFFVCIAATSVLVTLAAADRGAWAITGCAIYGASILAMFGTSALYHRRVWSAHGYRIMRRLDHSMIFVFIAGTYTPLCVMLLHPVRAGVILSIVWGGAALGVGMAMFRPDAPRWLVSPIYVVLGWVAIAVLPDMVRAGGLAAVILLLVGGIFYTVGATLYATRKPNPWPATFGHHEFFHACTLLAAACHQIAIYLALFH